VQPGVERVRGPKQDQLALNQSLGRKAKEDIGVSQGTVQATGADGAGERRGAERVKKAAVHTVALVDAIVAAVSHSAYLEKPLSALTAKLKPGGAFTDVKSAYDPAAVVAAGYQLWRL
jgi:hypothetical protein